jgi:hypothetical protein
MYLHLHLWMHTIIVSLRSKEFGSIARNLGRRSLGYRGIQTRRNGWCAMTDWSRPEMGCL